MQIAVIADDGEVIDSIDVSRNEMKALFDQPGPPRAYARAYFLDQLDTQPVRRFVGLPVKAVS